MEHEQADPGLVEPLRQLVLDPDPVSERRVRLWVSDIDVFAQKPVPSPLVKAEKWTCGRVSRSAWTPGSG
jgi:hypothetical protein